jgi:hypothetical protein
MLDKVKVTCKTLQTLHKKYIHNTLKKAIVLDETMFLCNLTRAVMLGCNIKSGKVYITTKVVKHLYDKRPAVQYNLILKHLHEVIKFPDNVYSNKSGKRGSLGFCKTIHESLLFASLEKVQDENGKEEIYIATSFETDLDYLKSYTLIWSWRGGIPSS